jgi:hypothetical protein
VGVATGVAVAIGKLAGAAICVGMAVAPIGMTGASICENTGVAVAMGTDDAGALPPNTFEFIAATSQSVPTANKTTPNSP